MNENQIIIKSLDSSIGEAIMTPVTLEEIKAMLIVLGRSREDAEGLRDNLKFYLGVLEEIINV
jgi:hypothetical protein